MSGGTQTTPETPQVITITHLQGGLLGLLQTLKSLAIISIEETALAALEAISNDLNQALLQGNADDKQLLASAEDIFENITVLDKNILIQLNGNITSTREHTDWLTLLFLKNIRQKGLAIQEILSDRTVDFIQQTSSSYDSNNDDDDLRSNLRSMAIFEQSDLTGLETAFAQALRETLEQKRDQEENAENRSQIESIIQKLDKNGRPDHKIFEACKPIGIRSLGQVLPENQKFRAFFQTVAELIKNNQLPVQLRTLHNSIKDSQRRQNIAERIYDEIDLFDAHNFLIQASRTQLANASLIRTRLILQEKVVQQNHFQDLRQSYLEGLELLTYSIESEKITISSHNGEVTLEQLQNIALCFSIPCKADSIFDICHTVTKINESFKELLLKDNTDFLGTRSIRALFDNQQKEGSSQRRFLSGSESTHVIQSPATTQYSLLSPLKTLTQYCPESFLIEKFIPAGSTDTENHRVEGLKALCHQQNKNFIRYYLGHLQAYSEEFSSRRLITLQNQFSLQSQSFSEKDRTSYQAKMKKDLEKMALYEAIIAAMLDALGQIARVQEHLNSQNAQNPLKFTQDQVHNYLHGAGKALEQAHNLFQRGELAASAKAYQKIAESAQYIFSADTDSQALETFARDVNTDSVLDTHRNFKTDVAVGIFIGLPIFCVLVGLAVIADTIIFAYNLCKQAARTTPSPSAPTTEPASSFKPLTTSLASALLWKKPRTVETLEKMIDPLIKPPRPQ